MSAPRVLLIGGGGFFGSHSARRLVAAGYDVTVLSRRESTGIAGVRSILADRRDRSQLSAALEGARFDATIDFCAYDAADVEGLLLVPYAALGRYILISSGQVYLVTESPPVPAREEDSERPLIPPPPADTYEGRSWAYGVGKRRAEGAALALRESHGVRTTILRPPVTHGDGDPSLRLWAYLERMLDGGPVLLPEESAQLRRYLWVEDLARALVALLGHGTPREAIYNLAGADLLPLRVFLERLAHYAGSASPLIEVSSAALAGAGLDDTMSPLSGRWSSVPDPSRAAAEWGFSPTRLDEWLPAVVRSMRERPPNRSHPGYAARSREIALASSLAAPRPA